ncbi:SusE domain-containing protein [Flavobacteriaceae bacterium S356]|uniref:SusE domain-containing protein n=1 Tax=Asprobacillus argus TaxID=3076534 RepID=A0ABU3LD20_9FLAO|nr:SusE domain-containing protein [Flavobacteriaceae bacterium S356]
MKNLKRFSITSVLSLVLLLFYSCDDNSDIFTVSQPTAPVLAGLNFTNIELDAVNTDNPALTLNWQHADYGVQASINYAIQFASDQDFTNPVTAATTTGQTSATLSVSQLNSAAGNAGLNPFEWATIYVRVVSSLGAQNGVQSTSNAVNFMVFPYFNYVFNDYFLVGDATAPGWDNNGNNPALFRDENDPNIFYYTGLFANNGHFKVLETKGLWQPQWGTDDGVTVGTNPGGGTDPERFPYGGGNGIPQGFYTFTINFASNTFTFEPFNASGITSPASLTLQGSSTANVAMTPLAFDGHIWYANNVRLTPGDVAFVTGSADSWGSTTSFSGVATSGGGSIPVIVEDDYDVWFNDLTGRYILIPLNL